MKITFVNHSSFILEYKETKIICDPWIEGTAFNNGWSLLTKTQLDYGDFQSVTHIWFSHEHPDHFAPGNLFKIPKKFRENITVLYQETTDRKVAEFCKKLNFKAIKELEQDHFFTLQDDFKLMCNAYTHGDSYAVFKTDDFTILNLNDCIVDDAKKAADLAHKLEPIDLLLTQFGYANKIGNKQDTALRLDEGKNQLECIRFQDNHLKPKYIIPFASFIFFCHEENYYMNDGMNTIEMTHDFIEKELQGKSIVMYPGDEWPIGSAWNSHDSIEKWSKDYKGLDSINYIKTKNLPLEELMTQARKFGKLLIDSFPKNRKVLADLSTHIFVSDQNQGYKFSVNEGLTASNKTESNCDISLTKESLFYVFKELWGGNTLFINARFEIPQHGMYENFRKFEGIAAKLNRGETYDFMSLKSRVINKLKSIFKTDYYKSS